MKNFNSAAAMAAIVLGFAAAAAGAQTTHDPAPKIVLQYSPASLDTESGVRRLYGRLVLAAEKVCEKPQAGVFASSAVIECRRHALADAVAQIHNARLADLSAAYAKKG